MITPTLAPAILPPGQRVYAIGDIHGHAERLAAMHARIAADLAARPVARATVIHLGDLIDRGPDSAGVIARLLRPWPAAPAPRVVTLMGNHEDIMLAAVDGGDRAAMDRWIRHGGDAALTSWGLSPETAPGTLWARLPPAHLAFVRGLPLTHQAGGYLFVHAGIRPGLALERQARHDLLSIREPFLSWPGGLPWVVVHGHTPGASPVTRPNRIGLDTGAALGGPLTCAVLEAGSLGFLAA